MDDAELRQVVRDVDVYARTSPEHKIRIVSALQHHGEVVAMTGDGVNDAPALTQADIGVAMGIKGTEATKDAAEIVLADDNFATIERAVEEGRRIYDNLRKSVLFLLPTNGAQSLVILIAVLFGWTLPLQPVQVLWINMVTAVTLSLALAGEKAETGIMTRPPRAPRRPAAERGVRPAHRRRLGSDRRGDDGRLLPGDRAERAAGRGADDGRPHAGARPVGVPVQLPLPEPFQPHPRRAARKSRHLVVERPAGGLPGLLHVHPVHARLGSRPPRWGCGSGGSPSRSPC